MLFVLFGTVSEVTGVSSGVTCVFTTIGVGSSVITSWVCAVWAVWKTFCGTFGSGETFSIPGVCGTPWTATLLFICDSGIGSALIWLFSTGWVNDSGTSKLSATFGAGLGATGCGVTWAGVPTGGVGIVTLGVSVSIGVTRFFFSLKYFTTANTKITKHTNEYTSKSIVFNEVLVLTVVCTPFWTVVWVLDMSAPGMKLIINGIITKIIPNTLLTTSFPIK